MAGRKTKLTPERKEKILECVRAGMSSRATAKMVGITEQTLSNWLTRGEKAKSGSFLDFFQSFRSAEGDFELSNLEIIRRSSKEETKILRQKVRYKGGQVVQGKLVNGEVDVAETITETRSPTAKGAMWLLARRFPKEWGQPQLEQKEARDGEAHDEKPRVVYYLPDNGRMRKMPGDEIVQLPEEKRNGSTRFEGDE